MHTPTMREIETVRRYARLVLRQGTDEAVLATASADGWLYALERYGQVRRPFRDARRMAF